MAEENQAADQAQAGDQGQQAKFAIQRIYVKDISFEAPNSPAIFSKEWKPEIKLDIDTRSAALGDDLYEVVLAVTVTATMGEETGFLCEVHQAGVFTIADMPDQNKAHTIGSFCPNVLFPYARECISNLVNRGTFPALNLAPVNFDAIFAQYLQKMAAQQQQQAEQAPKLDA